MIRKDIPDLYFDGDSFVLYALDLGGRKRTDVDRDFQEAVQAGVIIPFYLGEDCSYRVRLLDKHLCEPN